VTSFFNNVSLPAGGADTEYDESISCRAMRGVAIKQLVRIAVSQCGLSSSSSAVRLGRRHAA